MSYSGAYGAVEVGSTSSPSKGQPDVLTVAEGLISKLDNPEILSKYNNIKERILKNSPAPSSAHRSVRSPGNGDLLSSVERVEDSSTVQVLVRGLRNENELLRQQVANMASRERDQRAELGKVDQSVQRQLDSARKEFDELLLHEQTRLFGEMDNIRYELERERSEKLALSRKLESIEREGSIAGSRRDDLEVGFRNIRDQLVDLAQIVENYQHDILPTFRAPEPPQDIVISDRLKGVVQDSGIAEQLLKVERGVGLLKMIIDAKGETLSLIKKKLKEENNSLKAEVEQLKGHESVGQAKLLTYEQTLMNEKQAMKEDLESLQKLYEGEVNTLKAALHEKDQHIMLLQDERAKTEHQDSEVKSKVVELESENNQLRSQMQTDEASRMMMAAELAEAKKTADALKAELDTVKMSQKYLVRDAGRVPAEKMDLMKMVNSLLGEVNKLKSEKLAVDNELKNIKKEAVAHRVGTTVTARDIDRGASNDENSDEQLMSKILMRNLESKGPESVLQVSAIRTGPSPSPSYAAWTNPALSTASPAPVSKENVPHVTPKTVAAPVGSGPAPTSVAELSALRMSQFRTLTGSK